LGKETFIVLYGCTILQTSETLNDVSFFPLFSFA